MFTGYLKKALCLPYDSVESSFAFMNYISSLEGLLYEFKYKGLIKHSKSIFKVSSASCWAVNSPFFTGTAPVESGCVSVTNRSQVTHEKIQFYGAHHVLPWPSLKYTHTGQLTLQLSWEFLFIYCQRVTVDHKKLSQREDILQAVKTEQDMPDTNIQLQSGPGVAGN